MVPKELPVSGSDLVCYDSLSLHLPYDLSAVMVLRKFVEFVCLSFILIVWLRIAISKLLTHWPRNYFSSNFWNF